MPAFMPEQMKEVRSRSTSAGSSARTRGQSLGGSVDCSPMVTKAAAVPQIEYPFPDMEAVVGAARFGTSGFSLDGFFEERKVKSCPVSGISAPPGLEETSQLPAGLTADFDEIFNTASDYGSWAQEGLPLHGPSQCLPGSGAFLTATQLELLALSQEELRRQNAELLARIEQLEAASKAKETTEVQVAEEKAVEEAMPAKAVTEEKVLEEARFDHIFDTWNSEFGELAQNGSSLPEGSSESRLPLQLQSVLPGAMVAATESLRKSAASGVRMPPPPPAAAPPEFPAMQVPPQPAPGAQPAQPAPPAPPLAPSQAPFAQPSFLLEPPFIQAPPQGFPQPASRPVDIPPFAPPCPGVEMQPPAGIDRPHDLRFPVPPFQAPPLAPHPELLMMPPMPRPAPVQPAVPEPPAPPAPLGSERCPTIGSAKHFCGGCKPCAFFHTKGCEGGVNCEFCHLCGPGEKKRRQRDKYEATRIRSFLWRQSVAKSFYEQAAAQEAACQGMYPAAFRR